MPRSNGAHGGRTSMGVAGDRPRRTIPA